MNTYERNGKYRTIKIDRSKSYMCAGDALVDEGFEIVESFLKTTKNFSESEKWEELFKNTKTGKIYCFVSMYHFNTEIYSVRLAELEEVEE